MHISKIVREQLVNLGNYENIRVGAEITVGPTESADEAMKILKAFVDAEAKRIKKR
jgi:hypothetical protein